MVVISAVRTRVMGIIVRSAVSAVPDLIIIVDAFSGGINYFVYISARNSVGKYFFLLYKRDRDHFRIRNIMLTTSPPL